MQTPEASAFLSAAYHSQRGIIDSAESEYGITLQSSRDAVAGID